MSARIWTERAAWFGIGSMVGWSAHANGMPAWRMVAVAVTFGVGTLAYALVSLAILAAIVAVGAWLQPPRVRLVSRRRTPSTPREPLRAGAPPRTLPSNRRTVLPPMGVAPTVEAERRPAMRPPERLNERDAVALFERQTVAETAMVRRMRSDLDEMTFGGKGGST